MTAIGASASVTGFNPRAPCGARLEAFLVARGLDEVSTHAPRAGRDLRPGKPGMSPASFQPTRPVRGATRYLAMRALIQGVFQPTRPVRGATCGCWR